MKRIITIGLTIFSLTCFAQKGAFKIGFRLAPSSNIATVNDKDATPSDVNYIADGYTVKEKNSASVGVSFYIDYFLSDHVAFSTGLWFTQKNFAIRNYDGSTNHGNDFKYYYNYNSNLDNNYANGYNYHYSGVSYYKSTYLQLPILFKFYTNEIAKNLKIYVTVGPTFDFRTGEKIDGGDYAHYWNMAHNNPQYAYRDRNSTGRAVKLFNPVDVTLFGSVGVNYQIIDKLDVFGGIFVNKGFVNAINPKLRFAEPGQTAVNKGLSIKSFLVGMEMGVSYRLK